MNPQTFTALLVEETPEKQYPRKVVRRSIADLPDNDVLVRVRYSALNYKDSLSAAGNKGVTKHYPHTPGIDAAGIVEEDRSGAFAPGTEVIITGYDLGMNTPGGFGQYIRVPPDWVLRCPENLTLRQSMIYGTAGFTAALSVEKLASVVAPANGKILVSGASGAVGSMAIGLLHKLGYQVAAVSRGAQKQTFLEKMGVDTIVSAETAADTSGKPLLAEKWAGAVDTVGGDILATAVRATRTGGAVTCCGNVASGDLPLTVYPFILRGITLFGIDSQHCPMEKREQIWNRLAGEWKLDHLSDMAAEIGLEELDAHIARSLEGSLQGRIIIRITDS